MTTEAEILSVLRELEATVLSLKTAQPKPSLIPLFERIEQLAARLSPESDSELRHFLQKKSYEKARLWLEGRASENHRGGCRH